MSTRGPTLGVKPTGHDAQPRVFADDTRRWVAHAPRFLSPRALVCAICDPGADGIVGSFATFAKGLVDEEAGDRSDELSVSVICVSARTTVPPCWKTWALIA